MRPAVQHYAWGGYDYIPGLLGLDNSARRPCAELWIGAHPLAPALAEVEGLPVRLDALVERARETVLGPAAAARFAGLPYLLKVLDVRTMLSIQAHPDGLQAEEGFAREEVAGIALEAPQRNFKDRSHKPEAVVALTEFWGLRGFRPAEAIAATLESVPELRALLPAAASLRALYERVMTLPQRELDRMLEPLVARLLRAYERGELARERPDYWAARAAVQFSSAGHHDRGIVSIYLLNLVRLAPGEGMFLPAGVLHAYLEGAAVEVMASSDNVLRGGLTPKHVDLPGLLRILRFESGEPGILRGEEASPGERVYRTAAEEFELAWIELRGGGLRRRSADPGPEALLVLEGETALRCGDGRLGLARGAAVLVPAGLGYALESRAGAALVRVSLPPRA